MPAASGIFHKNLNHVDFSHRKGTGKMADNETMIQEFENYYGRFGSPESIVDFLTKMDTRLEKMMNDEEPEPDDFEEQVRDFYNYFSKKFGDNDTVMDKIEDRWSEKPPTILLLGFRFAVAEEEQRLASKYEKVEKGSSVDYNINQLFVFVATGPCKVTIIGPEDASYEFEYPMRVATDGLSAVDIVKGMLADFVTVGEGMIVRRFGDKKDDVYGFMTKDGSVESVSAETLGTMMAAHADAAMTSYLKAVEIKQASITFK